MARLMCAGVLAAGLLFAVGCQPQFHVTEARWTLAGTYVTVDVNAHGSFDPLFCNGPITLVAQNEFCAVETIGNIMYLTFPDGCRLLLTARQPDKTTTEPTTQATVAQIWVNIRGGRIDSGPIALGEAIRAHSDCGPFARRLAAAWLSTGSLDFNGRSVTRGLPLSPLTSPVSDRTIDFHAHARLTQAGEAVLQDALSTRNTATQPSTAFDQPTTSGMSPISSAAFEGNVDEVKKLAAEGKSVNGESGEIFTPLMWAASEGHEIVTLTLMELGANPNLCNRVGSSALMEAAQGCHMDVVKLLVTHGADVNAREIRRLGGYTPLMYAAARGCLGMCEYLLAHGANIDVTDRWGNTVAQIAASHGDVPLSKWLASKQAQKGE